MPKVVLTPENRGHAWCFANGDRRPPKGSPDEAWVQTGADPEGHFRQHVRLAMLVAYAETRARKAERAACVADLKAQAPAWADSGGDWALHSAAERIGAGKHVGGSNG